MSLLKLVMQIGTVCVGFRQGNHPVCLDKESNELMTLSHHNVVFVRWAARCVMISWAVRREGTTFNCNLIVMIQKENNLNLQLKFKLEM